MKKICILLLCAAMLLSLSACGGPQRYSADTFAFDTVINLTAYCDSEEQFQQLRAVVFDRFQALHKQFDIYHGYEGQNNLYTVNQNPGHPVAVSEEILTLLQLGVEMEETTHGLVNIAMGAVLRLWKTARDTGVLPAEEAIRAALAHCAINSLEIDTQSGTVTLTDPEASLDVGAIAKGWAAEAAADAAVEAGFTNFVISAGGNVVARGLAGDRPWNVGVRDPLSADANAHVAAVEATDTALVTSGGYERNLVVDGKTYCHIIDPFTGYPVDHMLSVTVICEDSGLADGYSTALFLMEPREALDFAKQAGIRAIIIDREGAVLDSQGE